jgi:hypothetical protein
MSLTDFTMLARPQSSKLIICVKGAASWLQTNRFHFNPDKTDSLWCTAGRRQHRLTPNALLISSVSIAPVRDLGIFVDLELVMRIHVTQTVFALFCCIAPAQLCLLTGSSFHFSGRSLLPPYSAYRIVKTARSSALWHI